MNKITKKEIEQIADKTTQLETTIFVIKRKHSLTITDTEEGMELNDGYAYKVDTPIPELADAIAKFAIELPKQGLGEGSDKYFIQLIYEYFNRLSSTDVK